MPPRTGIATLDIALSVLALLLVVRLVNIVRAKRTPKGLRLPPGPPGSFIGGNARNMPTHHDWETYHRWAKQYGGLVYVKVFGKPMIIVNTMEVAQDLLDKRSPIYSDRFEFPMLNDLMGFSYNFGLMRYGERWRRRRRVFQQAFHSSAVGTYHHVQIKQARTLLQNYHRSPDEFTEHIKHFAGAIILEIVYGIQVLPKNDPYIKIAEKAMAAMSEAGNPGTFLVDTLPILKHVPEWTPGAGFKKKARLWRMRAVDIAVAPFTAVKKAMDAGTAGPSLTASWLKELSHRPDAAADEETIFSDVAAVAYGAGSDTTASALTTFMLAMVLYPDVQRKGQAELDSVIGMHRLPAFEDRENLPYITAICKEVHRWRPVLPLGVAHRLMQDDVYGDYFIPGGSVVVINAWSILHDENVYGPRPDEFEPERFLEPGARDPIAQFGFGRRICAGRHLADDSIWMAVAYILKVFDIARAKDAGGNYIPVKDSIASGFMTRPGPFQCYINPRSASAADPAPESGDD